MNKNDEYEVEIEGYNSEGQGVARVDGFVVFVPFAIKGERVLIHIIKVQKSFAVGKIVEILKKSPSRVESQCPYFKKCGGCVFQHLEYEKACEAKRQIVVDAMTRIGKFENVNVKNTIKSANNYNYRNKFAFPVSIDEHGKARVCMFRLMSHEPVFIEKCPISNPVNEACISAAEEFFDSLNDVASFGLRHIVVRAVGGFVLFTLVSDKQPPLKGLFDLLKQKTGLDEKHIGLFHCKKNFENNVILEGELKHICGIESIQTQILGIKINISPMSFYQINDDILEKIYSFVIRNFNENDEVIDAYSGAGLMSVLLAKRAKNVFAIEIVEAATKDADIVKRDNKIENLQNINGDTAKILPKLAKRLKNFALVLDPPRKGADKAVLEAVNEAAPDKIVYVSCNPASLARDLQLLAGYEICELVPFDMFPQTHHVETVAVLKKLKTPSKLC